ncbi:unnamed protein product [Pseudo-nitzschia multistriata]|uniref:RNA helicase n=1 Tax=Pseudo-nitzschia multistriata TaxID=183589 RepID=A0A448ZKM4_9STRA|nr:unnamed protein product [Pseudo-nitzschia multistriata]
MNPRRTRTAAAPATTARSPRPLGARRGLALAAGLAVLSVVCGPRTANGFAIRLVSTPGRLPVSSRPARRRDYGGGRYDSYDDGYGYEGSDREGRGAPRRGRSGGPRGRSGYGSNNDENEDYDKDWSRPTQGRGRGGSRDASRGYGGRNGPRGRSQGPRQRGGSGSGSRYGGDRRNASRPPAQPEETAEITDTNAHFFSKKPLSDPTFYAEGGADGDNDASQELHEALCRGAGITRPSRIQSLAWPKILGGSHTIVADQTGSGKTCAYLIPCLLRALQSPPVGANGSPRVLVLAPTAELADQIRDVCFKISRAGTPFHTMVVTANGKQTTTIRDQIRMIQRKPADVLIGTPGRISTILRTRNSGLDLSHVRSIVLDEVDVLMIDETFGPQLRTVGAAAPLLDKTQFVFVTATLPDSIVETITTEFPGVVKVKGPGLHRPAPSLKENLVDVSVPSSSNRNEDLCFDLKAKALLKALRQNRCRRTLVFCNTVESCRSVENLLNRKDRRGRVFEVLAYHSAMTPEARNANLRVFARGRNNDRNEEVDYVLICTDRAARGVDFDEAPVNHCVVFDFPKDPAEYIRRVGRTARAGRVGTSTVFAYGWQLPIARSVMGKKLDSETIATSDMKYDENDYEPRFDRRTKKRRDAQMKSKIEDGSLWE